MVKTLVNYGQSILGDLGTIQNYRQNDDSLELFTIVICPWLSTFMHEIFYKRKNITTKTNKQKTPHELGWKVLTATPV